MYFAQDRVIVCMQTLVEATAKMQSCKEVIARLNHNETANKQRGKWKLWPCELLHTL